MPGMSSMPAPDAPREQISGNVEQPEPESSGDRRLAMALDTLAQMVPVLLDRFAPDGSKPVPPIPGKIDCLDCQGHMSDLRSALVGLEAHLELEHDFWPAEQYGVFLDAHKTIAQIGRVLRLTRHIARIQGDVDPYALVLSSAPDTTGTPASSPERLTAVLQRAGPSPMYDAAVGDLEPGAEPRVRVVEATPFLDGGGDAAAPEEGDGGPVGAGLGPGMPAAP